MAPPPGTRLLLVNFDEEHEREALYRQRLICGWGEERIDKWRKAVERKERYFFWIAVPATTPMPDTKIENQQQNNDAIARLSRNPDAIDEDDDSNSRTSDYYGVGHIALDWIDPEYPDSTLCCTPDGSKLQISSLFVLPSFGQSGIGAFAMDTLEMQARQPPYGSTNCKAVFINTMSSRYFNPGGIEGPDGIGIWGHNGLAPPMRDNGIWYAKRGYVKFQEGIRYGLKLPSGKEVKFYADYMRKDFV